MPVAHQKGRETASALAISRPAQIRATTSIDQVGDPVQIEGAQCPLGGHAVLIHAGHLVVELTRGGELLLRNGHPIGRPALEGDEPTLGQHLIILGDALASVKDAHHVQPSLTHLHHLIEVHLPARDRLDHVAQLLHVV